MTFEYKIVTSSDAEDGDDEAMLNELGEEGWELISVLASEVTYVDEESDDEAEEYAEEVVTYYLKRAKE